MAVDFPRYFGDAKHRRVTKTFSDPIGSSSSYNAVFLPFIPGQQPAWEANMEPLTLFPQHLSPSLKLHTCPGAGVQL